MSVPERISVRMLSADAVHAGQPGSEPAELRELLAVLAVIHQETLRQLDWAELKLDTTLAHLTGKAAD
jgi:hypothetical protein